MMKKVTHRDYKRVGPTIVSVHIFIYIIILKEELATVQMNEYVNNNSLM